MDCVVYDCDVLKPICGQLRAYCSLVKIVKFFRYQFLVNKDFQFYVLHFKIIPSIVLHFKIIPSIPWFLQHLSCKLAISRLQVG